MMIIPAIDIHRGQCVRLLQGQQHARVVYSNSPLEVAAQFVHRGAPKLHIIDLDGAFSESRVNEDTISGLLREIPIPIQLGGGIRSLEDVEKWLMRGASQVILGTLAMEQPQLAKEAVRRFGADRIIVAVDVRDHYLVSHGWQVAQSIIDTEFIAEAEGWGLQRLIYTEIARDGMLCGIPIDHLRHLSANTSIRITVAGGISSEEDIRLLQQENLPQVDSVIVGRALYEGKLDLGAIYQKYGGGSC